MTTPDGRPGGRLRTRARGLVPGGAALAAVLTWLVLLPAGVLGVRRLELDPLTSQGVVAPVAYGAGAGLAVLGLALWVRREWVVGVAAGVWAAWTGTAVAAMLVGTPYGFGSMGGDAGRMSALATHFSTTWVPSDAADPDLPPEYPPLYPMAVGRVAAWTGREAWTLLGSAQAALVSASMLAAFLLWRRVVPSGLALALSGSVLVGLVEPSKGNEVLALAVFTPWLLASFSPPPDRPRLHPVLAGVIAGLMVPWYPNFLMFGIVGVGLVLLVGWRTAASPRRYLLESVLAVGIATLLASWYLGPLLVAYSQGETQVVADLFKSGTLANQPFSLAFSTSTTLFVLQLVGYAGIVLFFRRAWWARGLGLLLAGVLVVRTVMLLRYVGTGHAFLLYYVPYLLRSMTFSAGLLTLWELWRLRGRWLLARTGGTPQLAQVGAVAAVLAVLGGYAWSGWLPKPAGVKDTSGAISSSATSFATLAHAEFLPDGRRPRYAAPTMTPGFPATAAIDRIDAALGRDADPHVLSTDQRIFSFRSFRNVLPPRRESSSALTRWDERKAFVDDLATVADPATMAARLADTPYGPVDVLVLKQDEKSTRWLWNRVRFLPSAFESPAFDVTRLPDGYVLVVRR